MLGATGLELKSDPGVPLVYTGYALCLVPRLGSTGLGDSARSVCPLVNVLGKMLLFDGQTNTTKWLQGGGKREP